MSLFAGLFAKMIGKAAKADGSVIGKLGEAIDNIIVTKNELEEKRLDHEAKRMSEQVDINKIEAAHGSIFVAGWRPAIGWIGAIAILYNFILRPLLEWAVAVWNPDVIPPPDLDTGPLYTIITAMLGIGVLRTWEKHKKVDTKKIK